MPSPESPDQHVSEELIEAKRQHELARLEADTERAKVEAARLRASRMEPPPVPRRQEADIPVKLLESLALTDFGGEFFSQLADYYDISGEGGWWGPAFMTAARRNGANWPFFRTEQELHFYRNASRWVVGRNPHASGLIGGVCSYVIGKGMAVKATPTDGTNDPADMHLCRLVQHELDYFAKRVNWPELQQQIFNETLTDGEYFLALFDQGDHLAIRGVLPELIKQPPGEPMDVWSFGIQTPVDDPWTVEAYHIAEYDGSRGHILNADEVIHFPMPTPGRWTRGIKRAMPLFAHGVKDAFDNAGKLLKNMGVGVAVRQKFAFFRQWDGISRESASDFTSAAADLQVQRTWGSGQSRNYQDSPPGMVVDAPAGMNFAALPSSPETSAAIEVVDALLRNAVAILNAPEWLASGNARNMGAYASSMVAESPFVKRCEQLQEFFGGRFLKVLERVVDIAVRAGRLPAEVLQRVKLSLEHPTLTARNKGEEASRDSTYVQMGVKSRQQVAQEQGLDYDKQFQENLDFQKKTLEAQIELAKLQQQLQQLQGGAGGGQPGMGGPPAGPGGGGDDGSGGPGGMPAPTMPGAEQGGDKPGEDLSPFGDVAESVHVGPVWTVVALTESMQVALLEAGFTGTIKDKLGRTYHYQDGKRISGAKAKETGFAEKHQPKDASVARKALLAVLNREDVTDQHFADIAEHLPAMTVRDLRTFKAALLRGVPARDKEALIERVREGARKRAEQSRANEERFDAEQKRAVEPTETSEKAPEVANGTPEAGGTKQEMTMQDVPSRFMLSSPIKGKNGATIVGYEWRHMQGEKYSHREEGLVKAKVSDWEAAGTSTGTGRNIVHLYYVKHPSGKVTVEGVRSAQNVLGIDNSKLATIAKREQAAQQYREMEEKRNAETLLAYAKKSNLDSPDKAARDMRERNKHAPSNRLDELFNDSVLMSSDGMFLRVMPHDVEALSRYGWSKVEQPAPSSDASVSDSPGFTGTDSLGREWQDGKLVAKQDDAGRAAPQGGGEPEAAKADQSAGSKEFDAAARQPDFGKTVQQIADQTMTGGYLGDNKVLISHAYEEAKKQFPGLTLDQFKQQLLRLNQERKITIGRADMSELLDPKEIEASLIAHQGGTFHTILSKNPNRKLADEVGKGEQVDQSTDGMTERQKRVAENKAGNYEYTLDEWRKYRGYDKAQPQEKSAIDAAHRKIVEDAAMAQLEVPPEVLADYPGISTDPVAEIKAAYDNATDLNQSAEQVNATLSKLNQMSKSQLLKVADALDHRGMASKPAQRIRDELRQIVLDRRSAEQRARMIRDDESEPAAENPAGSAATDQGFTGTDSQGREWVNGELVKKQGNGGTKQNDPKSASDLPHGVEFRQIEDGLVGLFLPGKNKPILQGESEEDIRRIGERMESPQFGKGLHAIINSQAAERDRKNKRRAAPDEAQEFTVGDKTVDRKTMIAEQEKYLAKGQTESGEPLPKAGDTVKKMFRVPGGVAESGQPWLEGTLERTDDGLYVVRVSRGGNGGVRGVKVGDLIPYKADWGLPVAEQASAETPTPTDAGKPPEEPPAKGPEVAGGGEDERPKIHGRTPVAGQQSKSFTRPGKRSVNVGEIINRNGQRYVVTKATTSYISDDTIEDQGLWSVYKDGAGHYTEYDAVPVESTDAEKAADAAKTESRNAAENFKQRIDSLWNETKADDYTSEEGAGAESYFKGVNWQLIDDETKNNKFGMGTKRYIAKINGKKIGKQVTVGGDDYRVVFRFPSEIKQMMADKKELPTAEPLIDDELPKPPAPPPAVTPAATTTSRAASPPKLAPKPKPSPAPAAAPKPSFPTRKVTTSRGDRHAYSFTPDKAFWDMWRADKERLKSKYGLSLDKDQQGNWRVTLWGATPGEVERNATALSGRGVRVRESVSTDGLENAVWVE